MHHWCIN